MEPRSEGVRRLGLVLGAIGFAVTGCISGALLLLGGGPLPTATSAVLLLLPVLGFFIPWIAVNFLAWIIAGFFIDRRRKGLSGPRPEPIAFTGTSGNGFSFIMPEGDSVKIPYSEFMNDILGNTAIGDAFNKWAKGPGTARSLIEFPVLLAYLNSKR